MDFHVPQISIVEYPCMQIKTSLGIVEDWHPKIMDIHKDSRRNLKNHVWIGYGFSDQRKVLENTFHTYKCLAEYPIGYCLSVHIVPFYFNRFLISKNDATDSK